MAFGKDAAFSEAVKTCIGPAAAKRGRGKALGFPRVGDYSEPRVLKEVAHGDRRGWAERKDIINAWPLEKMLKFLK